MTQAFLLCLLVMVSDSCESMFYSTEKPMVGGNCNDVIHTNELKLQEWTLIIFIHRRYTIGSNQIEKIEKKT